VGTREARRARRAQRDGPRRAARRRLPRRTGRPGRAAAARSAAGRPAPVDLPLHLSSFLADPRRWNELVAEDGDVALGGTLKELAQALPWFIEDTFARTLGDVIGMRVADAGRQLLALPGHAAERLAHGMAAYARDEAQLLARGDDMRRLAEQSAGLAARARSLETRLTALERSVSAPAPSTFVDAGAGRIA